MSQELAAALDLETAWSRVREDITRNRCFVVHPYEVQVIESNLSEWLASIREQLIADRYNPASAYICEVPKSKGAIRPGALLTITDRLIYAACLGACMPQIR